jgi:hypothetical protein
MRVLLVAATVLCVLPSSVTAAILATRVNPANGHTYHLLTPSTWTAAEAEAVSLGGHLVTINNAAEHQWLGGFHDLGVPILDSLWIGLNDAAREGVFVWASGQRVTYTNWAPGEPNNATGGPPGVPVPGDPGEDYVQAWIGNSSRWNDIKDDRPFNADPNGVVEIEVVPEPAASLMLALGGCLLHGQRRSRTAGRRDSTFWHA